MRGKTIACLGQSVTAAYYFVQAKIKLKVYNVITSITSDLVLTFDIMT